jgi:CubicO group peptidase (beta-lactamase class C family)
MKRRSLLISGGAGLLPLAARSFGDEWGAQAGYPTGWGEPRRIFSHTQMRVGNYSGGFESMLPVRTISAGGKVSPLMPRPRDDISYGFTRRTPQDYLKAWPITGLLIARKGEVWFEGYGLQRTAQMRMTGWSMSKSVTSLLLGICVDRGLVRSIDDRCDTYAKSLAGTLHGETTIRNLINMSTGLALTGDQIQDNGQFYGRALLGSDPDVVAALRELNTRREPQGSHFLYNDMAASAVGVVIREVTRKSLSEFAQEALWGPLGAEGNATWWTDSKGAEFNCTGFAATLRDWARLGQLVAQRGRMNGAQLVSEAWIQECCSWGAKDSQVRVNYARPSTNGQIGGYKAMFWHLKSDGSRPIFNGFHGQRIYIDMPTETVMVQTCVDHDVQWRFDSFALFDAAVALKS